MNSLTSNLVFLGFLAFVCGCNTGEGPTLTSEVNEAGQKPSDGKHPLVVRNVVETVVFDKSVPYPERADFFWYKNVAARSEALDMMLKSSLAKGFSTRGFTLNEKGRIGFYVTYYLVSKSASDADLNRNYTFKDGKRWRPGKDVPREYRRNTLVIDVVCGQDFCPRWRGAIQMDIPDSATPEEKSRIFQIAINRLLRKFPPPGVRIVKFPRA